MLFRKKFTRGGKPDRAAPPIETALNMIWHALIIAYGYQHNTRYKPTEHELQLFDLFTDELWQSYCTAQHIQRCLQQRLHAEEH